MLNFESLLLKDRGEFHKRAIKEWSECPDTVKKYVSYIYSLKKKYKNTHNSAILYTLGITDVKPVGEVDKTSGGGAPDLDLDFGHEIRHKVVDYVNKKYGHNRVAHIIAFGSMRMRAAIRDVARAQQIENYLTVGDKIAKAISVKVKTFDEAVKGSQFLQREKEKYPELFAMAEKINGKIRQPSTHPAGILVTPEDITEYLPLYYGSKAKEGDTSITQWDMYDIEETGFLKIDFLGLKTLTVIDNTVKDINKLNTVKKVISGGQTGADIGGLRAAFKSGYKTGGVAAKDYMTESGPNPNLKKAGLVDEGLSYKERTTRNVEISDGTVIFGNITGGTLQTKNDTIRLRKKYIENPTPVQLRRWIAENKIEVLNIAGNRESKNEGIEEYTEKVVYMALKKFNAEDIPLDDPDTLHWFSEGLTTGIFQLERKYVQDFCRKMGIQDFNDVVSMNAIIRPGTMDAGQTDHFIARRHGSEEAVPIHPAIEEILASTQQIIVFQEQAMKIAQVFAGFNLAEADNLRKCISGDSAIITKGGTFTIKELKSKCKKGKVKVLTVNEKGKHIYSKLIDVWKSGVKPVFRVRTKSGYNIEATKDHQIFTQDGWKKVQDITKNDFVVVTGEYEQKGYGKIKNNLAAMLGYFIAEGYYTNTTEPKITNSDKNVINFITKTLQSNFGSDSYKTTYYDNGVCDIYFKNLALKWIKKIVPKDYSNGRVVPTCVKSAYSGRSRSFISAYFDGDGTVSDKNISMTSMSEKLLQWIQISLIRDGIYSSLMERVVNYNGEEKKGYVLAISSKESMSRFYGYYNCYVSEIKLEKMKILLEKELIYENERFYIPNNFIKVFASSHKISKTFSPFGIVSGTLYNSNITYTKANRINSFFGDDMLTEILEADYKFSPIDFVEEVGKKEVYDFTVENNTHCTFANGILVHNCIGKKLPEKMKQMKSLFLEKSVEEMGHTKEETEEVFSNIETAARYAFNRCLTPDSVVKTKDGYKELQEISIGDKVLTPSEDGDFDEYVEVYDKFDTGEKDVYEIQLESGKKIKATLDHKFLCEDKKKHKLEEILEKGLRIMCVNE